MATVSVKQGILDRLAEPQPGIEARVLESLTFAEGTRIHIHRPGAGSDATPPPDPQTHADATSPKWALISVAGVLAAGIALAFTKDSNYSTPSVAVAGLSVFAGIYAAAQAIERLLEPLSSWLLGDGMQQANFANAVVAADKAVQAWASNPTPTSKGEAEGAMSTMASAMTAVGARRDERVAVFWGIASVIGMLSATFLHLYLLKLVGVITTHGFDVFATGLVVGAGTKPLHDLITKVLAGSSANGSGSGDTTTTATSP